MENFNLPPGGEPEDAHATQQFWPPHSTPAGQWGPGAAGGTGSPQPQPRPRRARRWAAGIAAAVLLAAGGAAAGMALSGPPASQPSGQAAALDAVLSSANSATGLTSPNAGGAARLCARRAGTGTATPAASAGPGSTGARQRAHPRLARLRALACHHRLLVRALLRGLHGQFTFQGKHGTRTLAFERGSITSVTPGSDLVVRATDGTTWTWHLTSTTVVREHGAKVTTSALAQGETVWVGGPVAAGARSARLILIRPAASSSGSVSSSQAG